MLGLLLVILVWVIVIVTGIAGGIFIRLLSGGYAGRLGVLKSTFSWFRLFKNPRFLAVLVLTLLGLGLIIHSYTVNLIEYEATAYRYLLGEQPIYNWVDDKLITTYKYRLHEIPIKTLATFYDTFFKPLEFFAGAALIVLALILTGFFLAKENNKIYGAKKFSWEEG